MKIMIIDFIRHNCWGTTNWATHYYVNGKRVSKNTYLRYRFDEEIQRNWKWEKTDNYTKVKDGITRNYTEIIYSPR